MIYSSNIRLKGKFNKVRLRVILSSFLGANLELVLILEFKIILRTVIIIFKIIYQKKPKYIQQSGLN